jgi:hypothetical protein
MHFIFVAFAVASGLALATTAQGANTVSPNPVTGALAARSSLVHHTHGCHFICSGATPYEPNRHRHLFRRAIGDPCAEIRLCLNRGWLFRPWRWRHHY